MVKVGMEDIGRDETIRLANDCPEGTGVQFTMSRDRQHLSSG